MTVTTGGMEPARGAARVFWWVSLGLGVAFLVAALVTGQGGFAGGGFMLVYPLQRLFWSKPGSDPSKTGWQRARGAGGEPPEVSWTAAAGSRHKCSDTRNAL
jgi:hypothetical protein